MVILGSDGSASSLRGENFKLCVLILPCYKIHRHLKIYFNPNYKAQSKPHGMNKPQNIPFVV